MVYVLKSNSQLLHSDSLFSVIQSLCVMDSMFPAWALTALLLSYTLGVPIQNSTSGPNLEYFLNDTVTNSSVSEEQKNATNLPVGELVPGLIYLSCNIFTCATQELTNKMQTGDEKAGESTQDPYGPGKK
ncbi:uncharacterized protein zgc:193726 isoform X9 [Xyrauchen texanus]|uniref:uncharacterized protein zgc:193726 isoform X7 n=1 Tax=Xyrauchen texanus TaxID=154827 RepID=UPI00224247B9|nr:uncharacterized protein zgc:193726 isoform X7 [Xyrauchen texanus]XP_051974676.1 uncharacterized protein zgc:193726 isoform X8 [Xyrauchen texanus]XP_051974677.1 uncharacterized protein zgc:193726 isoform X9 [Xyrauchen texanus]